MPQANTTFEIARPIQEVFAFFAQPAQLVQLAPPELHLELLEVPERLALGARLRWKVRRWGLSQQFVNEVTAFEENALLAEEQRQGPFAQWRLTRRFEIAQAGTQVVETIEFEPPRGMLGLLLTQDALLRELQVLFEYREQKLRTIFV